MDDYLHYVAFQTNQFQNRIDMHKKYGFCWGCEGGSLRERSLCLTRSAQARDKAINEEIAE